jgi:hypothetical protein
MRHGNRREEYGREQKGRKAVFKTKVEHTSCRAGGGGRSREQAGPRSAHDSVGAAPISNSPQQRQHGIIRAEESELTSYAKHKLGSTPPNQETPEVSQSHTEFTPTSLSPLTVHSRSQPCTDLTEVSFRAELHGKLPMMQW